MTLKKNDFVEIEFTGKLFETGEIFDTTVEKDAEDAKLDVKGIKPLVMAVGQKMLPEGFDSDIIDKEIGKSYDVDLSPEKAFGKRNPKMIRMIPTKQFHEQKINPVRGMQLSLDGQLVKVLSSDKGRTLIDFNNPLSGKKVSYNYKINRIVEDEEEKVDALQEFLFRRKFDFDVKDKVVKFKVEKDFEPFVKMFAQKFEEILGLKVETEIVEKKVDSESDQ